VGGGMIGGFWHPNSEPEDADETAQSRYALADDIYWALMARLPGGRTLSRRIELLQPLTTPEAAP
jgi:hypothetical protein